MARRRHFVRREPIGVTMRRNRAALLAFAPTAKIAARLDAKLFQDMPALPKSRGPRADHDDLEKHVLAAVGDLLAAHPQVSLAVRQNSGSLPYDRDGKPVPIWFYRIVKQPEEMTLPDYWGYLRDGRPFAIECKRPSWKWSGSDRELKQRAFLRLIECFGGVSGFATSADEAKAIIP